MTPKKDTLAEWRALPAKLRGYVFHLLRRNAKNAEGIHRVRIKYTWLDTEQLMKEAVAMKIAARLLRDLGKPGKRGAK